MFCCYAVEFSISFYFNTYILLIIRTAILFSFAFIETKYFVLMKEYLLEVVRGKTERGILGPKKEEIRVRWRKLHN